MKLPVLLNRPHAYIIAPLILLLMATLAPEVSALDPGQPDSIIVPSTSFQRGEQAYVEVWTVSDEWLTGIEITLTWDWAELVVDRFVFNPARFDGTTATGFTPDSNNVTIFAFPTNDQLISPGREWLGILTFIYPDTTDELLVTIDTTTLFMNDSLLVRANFFRDTISPEPFIPQFQAAELVMNICCTGTTGNTDCDVEDKRNLADISRLIDRVYLTKLPLCCEAEGNVDGDLEAKLNLSDITRLIDHVYLSKQETAPCL